MSPPLASPSQSQKLRVLCLHGFRTSGIIMETQMRKLDRTALDLLDMTFLDAPYPAEGKSDVEGIFPPPYYEWFQFTKTDTGAIFRHLKECIQFISDFMEKHGPFDGIVGFSQGAFLSAALAGMQEQGLALTSVPQLRFVIVISGGVLDGEHEWRDCYSEPIKCPSLHFIGTRDFLQPRNEELLLKFANPIVIRHEARHTVPRLDEKAVLPMKTFLERILSVHEEDEDGEHVILSTVKEQEGHVPEHSTATWTYTSCAALA
ncbi:hypothetical protein GOP47_0020544 [Adiantum capillus-veneris]|uniref:Serine hydrolase domain-containing protein n=1 Tax=Adiantum capillus-veneris TaxID=13818 RepID=A0A9D4U9B0_ADICA|nr:hypothetical protein GOP47_0020544 [Adiantum capillus-veneris]